MKTKILILTTLFSFEYYSQERDYINEALLNNEIAKLNVIFKKDSLEVVLIRCKKGYATGELVNGTENKNWLLYNSKGKLIKKYYYTLGELNKVIEYDKNGKIINESQFNISW